MSKRTISRSDIIKSVLPVWFLFVLFLTYRQYTIQRKRVKDMAKRFYDTNLVNQEWYMNLSPKHKALYMHLLCTCDITGVFEVNYRMMSVFVNDTITEEDVFGTFGNRIIPLLNHGTKGLVVDFISFQCGGELNPRVKAHMSIIKRLNDLGITPEEINEWCNHKFTVAQNQPVQKPTQSVFNAKPVDYPAPATKMSLDYESMFNELWRVYPRHDVKKLAKNKFATIMKGYKNEQECRDVLTKMLISISQSAKSEQWTKQNGQFIPMLTTWLNQRRWEDEGIVDTASESKAQQATLASTIAKSFKI